MSVGYGLEPWGTGPWSGIDAPMSISYAFAISTHEVVVVLSKPPQDITGFLVGDVSNGGSWSVSIPSTNEVLEIAGVAAYNRPTKWVIRTLQRLPDSLTTARITATTLKDASGGVVQSPRSADFAGVTEKAIATPQAISDTRTRTGRDLFSAPSPLTGDTGIGGTLKIVGGDYALQQGAELVRKLIMRRLMATPGEFFHLPGYGVGFRVKQALTGGGLVKLKAKLERQLLLEPDVASVTSTLTQAQNTLTCIITVTLAKTGQQVTVAMSSPIGQG